MRIIIIIILIKRDNIIIESFWDIYTYNMDRSLEQKYTIHRSLDIRISEVKNVFSGEKQQSIKKK